MIALLDRDTQIVLGDDALYVIPDGWSSITVGTPIADPDNGLASSPSAVSGLICVWGNLQGLISVTVSDDLAYIFVETISGGGGTFDYYFIDPITGDIGATGTITIPSEPGAATTTSGIITHSISSYIHGYITKMVH